MTTYGIMRKAYGKNQDSCAEQAAKIRAFSELSGLGEVEMLQVPVRRDLETGPSASKSVNWLLHNAQPGDFIVVPALATFGRPDVLEILAMLQTLTAKGAKVAILDFNGQTLTVDSEVAHAVASIGTTIVQDRRESRRERIREALAERKAYDRPVNGNVPFGRRLVERRGSKWLEWDEQQLGIILEIARRYTRGDPISVIAGDLWRRKVRDQCGRFWGRSSRKSANASTWRYQQIYRAVKWFFAAGQRGELPFLFNEYACALSELAASRRT